MNEERYPAIGKRSTRYVENWVSLVHQASFLAEKKTRNIKLDLVQNGFFGFRFGFSMQSKIYGGGENYPTTK